MSAEFVCRACAGTLRMLPDSRPLLLICDQGHVASLDELLDGVLPVRAEATVRAWEARAVSLARLAGRALENGHLFLAADFQDASRRILERIAGAQPVAEP